MSPPSQRILPTQVAHNALVFGLLRQRRRYFSCLVDDMRGPSDGGARRRRNFVEQTVFFFFPLCARPYYYYVALPARGGSRLSLLDIARSLASRLAPFACVFSPAPANVGGVVRGGKNGATRNMLASNKILIVLYEASLHDTTRGPISAPARYRRNGRPASNVRFLHFKNTCPARRKGFKQRKWS